MCGWIKLYRTTVTDWEWWGEHNTVILWLYILMTVNHKEGQWRGITVKPGQMVTSISKMASKTGLSVKKVRTSLKRLQKTGEVAIQTASTYSIVTVRKWEDFQGEGASETAGNSARERATIKEVKNKRIKDIGEFVASLTPSEKLREAISDWIDMRIKNKKPPTEKAILLAYGKVKDWASTEDEAVAIFNQSTLNNWSGVFPIKE